MRPDVVAASLLCALCHQRGASANDVTDVATRGPGHRLARRPARSIVLSGERPPFTADSTPSRTREVMCTALIGGRRGSDTFDPAQARASRTTRPGRATCSPRTTPSTSPRTTATLSNMCRGRPMSPPNRSAASTTHRHARIRRAWRHRRGKPTSPSRPSFSGVAIHRDRRQAVVRALPLPAHPAPELSVG
jgi:hypothetical protein